MFPSHKNTRSVLLEEKGVFSGSWPWSQHPSFHLPSGNQILPQQLLLISKSLQMSRLHVCYKPSSCNDYLFCFLGWPLSGPVGRVRNTSVGKVEETPLHKVSISHKLHHGQWTFLVYLLNSQKLSPRQKRAHPGIQRQNQGQHSWTLTSTSVMSLWLVLPLKYAQHVGELSPGDIWPCKPNVHKRVREDHSFQSSSSRTMLRSSLCNPAIGWIISAAF